jgi:selenocysteine lyase/cysteine desulfurase
VRSGWPFPEYDLDWAESAIRYQGGALNWIGVCALAESLTLQDEIGADVIAQRVLELTDAVIERLDTLPVEVTSSRNPEHRSSYLTFTLGSIEWDDALVEAGRKQNVFFGRRGGGIRVGTHFWNDESDIDRLAALIESATR